MSAQPKDGQAPDLVSIEVDGRELEVAKGSMIIQATDDAGIPVPRFCYHDKLPIAANCRMCLVDVEKAPKPMPACATPVADGMKVYTRSKRALDAQRNVMEFLLINHPLDCPICDQGGECELQDLSMGYGRSVSRFVERKRVVADEDLGPLVATDMTRCIHCTRCVRVTGEIAGTYELGGMQRGENLVIGTHLGKPLETELSGNVIDVCPVGALTNKVFRFRARPWELIARESIGWHDALGSNLFVHLRRGEAMRVVPRDNEAINECWLSDRDRWSHQGLAADDRVTAPLLRDNGRWREISWDEALQQATSLLRAQPGEQLGMLVHPATSNEEGALLARLAAGLGCSNIDHRLRVLDFADAPVARDFDVPVAALEQADRVLLVGCNIRHEMPLVSQRLRKAQRRGASIHAINPVDFDFNFELASRRIVAPSAMVDTLLALAHHAGSHGSATPPAGLAEALAGAATDADMEALAAQLARCQRGVIVLGEIAAGHPQASWLRALARYVADCLGLGLDEIPLGANPIGLAAHGVLPSGLDAATMLAEPRQAYLLYGCEPPDDFADGASAMKALSSAGSVVAFSAYASDALRSVAKLILPIGLLPEIDATLVNCDGIEQSVTAGARLPGDSRAGWRVLRALGAQLGIAGFEFTDLAGLRAGLAPSTPSAGSGLAERAGRPRGDALERLASVPIYRGDATLRRAAALNAHPLTRGERVLLHPEDALSRGLSDGAIARIDDGRGKASLPVIVDRRVARGVAWIESCYGATAPIAPTGASLDVAKA